MRCREGTREAQRRSDGDQVSDVARREQRQPQALEPAVEERSPPRQQGGEVRRLARAGSCEQFYGIRLRAGATAPEAPASQGLFSGLMNAVRLNTWETGWAVWGVDLREV